ncbi:MAG: helix-turn-helix transcriptional regulator [Myxococcales bacterium]|nr:helix-turn-helix transcriptional regulator [Myxococcales bacterium]
MWELRHEPATFRELREHCDAMSPTVLNDRLKTLRENGLVALSDEGYVFTTLGRELAGRLLELDRFAKRWARRGGPAEPVR